MQSRGWALIGVGAAAVAGGYLWHRGGDTPAPAPAPAATAVTDRDHTPAPVVAPAASEIHTATAPPPGAGHVGSTPAPALPALPDPAAATASVTPDLAQVFAGQPRDERWAATTESEIHRRTGALRAVSVSDVACKTSICKLVVSGETGAVATATDALGSPRVFRTWVTTLMLSAPSIVEGRAQVTAYVTFPPTVPNSPDD